MSVNIKVQEFEGPLDLLLQLIEEHQLDITTLALASVTEQFLEYVRNLQEKQPLMLADFLVIAAKLLVIKSKSLLPNLDLSLEEEESATDLTAQLLLYKKYKTVGQFLRKMDLKRRQSWTREVDFYDRVTFLPDASITVDTIAQSLRKLATELKDIVRLPQQIMAEVVSITEKIEHLQKLISEKIQISLASIIKDSKSRTEVIVTFLALLELVKQKILIVDQNEIFSDIIIRKIQ